VYGVSSLGMRWLALDIGSRRVGVAICDAEERLASSLPVIEYRGPERLTDAVAELVRARGAEGVVVGVPITRAGRGRGEQRVSTVVASLRRRLEVPVETADESGTTSDARSLLAETGVPPRQWPELVDSVAARLILEGYLAERQVRRSRR
jgi:putative Holliday junction resolvase